MSLPREPRQKMINMMYLVLTALLALNVAAEILNAFKTVNNSLEKSNEVVGASTTEIMGSLQAKTTEEGSKEKALYWYPKAQQATSLSSEVYTFIQGLKDQILTDADGDPNDKEKKFKEDNLDIATHLLVEKGKGKELYSKLDQYQKSLLGIDTAIAREFNGTSFIDLTMPKTSNKGNNTWEAAYFRMVPTVAAITILSKFQNDVKNAENKVVNFCHEQVGKVQLRFDAYEAIVGQNSKVLLPGQELEIQAGLAAFNSEKKPEVFIGGRKVDVNAKGLAIWNNKVSSSGKVPVVVKFTNQDGQPEERKFDVEYTVGQSNAAVQLDKMNVLFIGVDNPITVSGSGNVDQLKVSAQGGGAQLSRSGIGKYTVRVNQETDNCVISVTTPDGKVTPVNFRVRSIPDPVARVGTAESGDINASVFRSQAGVNALVKNFFYETQFNVTSFTMTGDGAGFENGIESEENTGAAWNQSRKIVNKVRPGSYITIENIRAVGPDGRTRRLNPLIFNVK